MTRILVSGDSHADINHVKSMKTKAEKFECDSIYVVGDYGFFPTDKGGKKFLDACSKLEVPVYFTAGNHEDWDTLDRYVSGELAANITDQGFIEVHTNVFYAPTGLHWDWDGVHFMSVGGAYSVDRRRRVKFISWFPQEVITEEDMLKTIRYVGDTDFDDRDVDILFCHDTPSSVDLVLAFTEAYNEMGFWFEPETELNRERLQEICDWWKPRQVIHGHYHLPYTQRVETHYGNMNVMGLDCNATTGYYTVIDTEDWNG